jgi:hypothetical protein
MPIHNWAQVDDGLFHWFHQRWIGAISDWLNEGRLPEGFYAIGELYADNVIPDILAVEDRPAENGRRVPTNGYGIAVAETPPKMRFSWEADPQSYLAKQNLLALRNIDGILVAVVEIVSPGNKSSKDRFQRFLTKTTEFLAQGIHVLVIDLFPPTPRDPHGIHEAIWSEAFDGEFEFQPDKPLTLASYMAGGPDDIPRAFVEPIAVGEVLPLTSLFLWPGRYINVDLEATYQNAWAVFPAPLKPKIQGG